MADVERRRSWPERVPFRFLSLLASGALLALGVTIVYRRINWHDVAAVWAGLDPKLVVLAAVLYWLQYPINSFRLQRVIAWLTERSSSSAPALWFLFKLTCSSGFVAVAAPIGLAGDAAKIVALRMFGSLSMTNATRCALFDRVVGVQWICIIGLAALPPQAAAGVAHEIILPQFVVFAGLITAVGILLVLPRALALIGGDLIGKIARVFADYRSVLLPQRSAIQAAIALLNLILAAITLYLLLLAAGLNVNFWLVAAFIPLLQLVNGLPFLYMGWGGREIAMVSTLGAAASLSMDETLAVSIAWGAVLIMTGVINGIFLIGDWHVNGRAPDVKQRPKHSAVDML